MVDDEVVDVIVGDVRFSTIGIFEFLLGIVFNYK